SLIDVQLFGRMLPSSRMSLEAVTLRRFVDGLSSGRMTLEPPHPQFGLDSFVSRAMTSGLPRLLPHHLAIHVSVYVTFSKGMSRESLILTGSRRWGSFSFA